MMTNDPDLDQACEDLAFNAIRLRQLQQQFARMDPVKHYSTLAARKFELADEEEAFRLRGEKLRMHPDRRLAGRALLLVVEHADRLRTRMDPAVIARMGLARAKRLGEVGGKGGGTDSTPRIGTPPAFRDLLLSIARTAKPERLAA